MDFALFSHIPWPEEHAPKRLYSDLTEQAMPWRRLPCSTLPTNLFEEFQMDFALFSHIPWPEEHAPKRLYSDLTEQAIIGEELGFKAIWLAEHHFTRYGLGASSLVIASNIAARTNHIRLGTAVLIPPLHHPVRLAEDTATLDVLSDGRLDVGFGREPRHPNTSTLGLTTPRVRHVTGKPSKWWSRFGPHPIILLRETTTVPTV